MKLRRRWWCNGWMMVLLAGIAVIAWAVASPIPFPGYAGDPPPHAMPVQRADLAGFTQAEQRLGDAVPTGAGVILGHVEGDPGQYMPDISHHRYRALTLHPRSGESETFGHAEATARIIFGPQGLAHGIREVHHFASHPWLTDDYLKAGTPHPPVNDRPRVFNHSWIGRDSMDEDHVNHLLRRVDYAIDRHGVIMCVGVNNGRTSRVPGLLSSAYNVIAVGMASGTSSGGGTRYEGRSRSKPDIAAPGSRTSFSTPVVTAAAARMLEAARALDQHAELASRPETIKALLMAGATKPWNWRGHEERPLDPQLGAGAVHLDNALQILEAGRAKPNEPRAGHGWDMRVMQPGGRAIYRIDASQPLGELSVMLVWHRRIDGRTAVNNQRQLIGWIDTPRLARFDLRVVHVDADGKGSLLADSLSDIDNVQHVYATDAPAGEYLVVVSRRDDGQHEPWPVAVAWRAGEHIPYPGD